MNKRGLWLLAVILVGTTGCPDSSLTGRDPILWDGYHNPFRDIERMDGLLDTVDQTDGVMPDEVGPQACLTDDDCPLGLFCDPESSVCVQCYNQNHCRPGELCQDNRCVEMPTCGPDKECPEGSFCLEAMGICVACIIDEQCPPDYLCEKYECLPRPPCESDADCDPPMVCSPHLGVCVECLNDGDCTLDQWCEVDSGQCLADLCDAGQQDCVSGGFMVCLENGSGFGDLVPCPDGTYCEGGECVTIKVCIPGESVCLSTLALKVCAEDGNSWVTKQCAADETCVDLGNQHAACQSGCTTQCDELPPGTCGPNGCGGICNNCFDGETCDPNVFLIGGLEFLPCIPKCSCEGLECGEDGCGNSCGQCGPMEMCQAGVCVMQGTTCSEGWQCVMECAYTSSSGQISDVCVQKCVEQTQTDEAGKLLNLVSCVVEACPNQAADPACMEYALKQQCAAQYEKCITCQPDCMGLACGSDGCGGSCGECGPDYQCVDGICLGSGSCASVLTCLDQQAEDVMPVAWCIEQATPEGQQAFYELYYCVMMNCDIGFVVGSACYEMAISGLCAAEYQECLGCQPNCFGKQCGADGCGGQCGTCPSNWVCQDSQCICKPTCLGKECGSDGCGGLCGVCDVGFACSAQGLCGCTENCVGKECGPDGCGGTCGVCQLNSQCTVNGSCLPFLCNPGDLECDGNMRLICPEDAAGWVELGECANGTWCVNGLCKPWTCTPGQKRCEGNGVSVCAENGAGWLPPELCPTGTVCNNGICIPSSGCGDIPAAGCCDGTMAVLCLNGTIIVKDCGSLGCGWSPQGSYVCGGTGPDPSGLFPMACPGTCQPECDAKQCGSDGCGGSCGTCALGWTCEDGSCEPLCVPQCSMKACGSDGCGGVCGLCGPTQECNDAGVCVQPPTCSDMMVCARGCVGQGEICGQTCSADGSGLELAEFQALWSCVVAKCPANSPSTCFDQAVLGGCYSKYLPCISCSPSCEGRVCGPDGCGGTCGQCDAASQCVSGQCQAVCVPACSGKECGSNGCGGSCGLCPAGYECQEGKCIWPCMPLCTGKQCGDDGCGGSCGTCMDGTVCSPDGLCLTTTVCGDGKCDTGIETCVSCATDCGACTNGCIESPLPGCSNCSCEACVCMMMPECCSSAWGPKCVEACGACGGCGCTPTCAGKVCGPDGCGGVCGTCPAGNSCQNGLCIPSCVPDCAGKECGTNGCGGTCGVCPTAATCIDGQCFEGLSCPSIVECSLGCISISGTDCIFDCMDQGTSEGKSKFMSLAQCVIQQCQTNMTEACFVSAIKGACIAEYNVCVDCTPSCSGKKCGPDGCDGSCGACPQGYACENYQCVTTCQPQCVGKQCGNDGCGGSCGTCNPGYSCSATGICQIACVPSCTGKQCGSDGCGGSCGTCPVGTVCSSTNMCIPSGPVCGDGACSSSVGETCTNCPKDCGTCGSGCEVTTTPTCGGCSCQACVCAKDPFCCEAQWDQLCVDECADCGGCGCVPNCLNKQCGDDGCGGSCGSCGTGFSCLNGKCSNVCTPSCVSKQCGSNGCGGSCGTCPDGFVCSAQGACVPSCVPDCQGRECGPDGCNGLCGLCGPDEACLSGGCVTAWDCNQLLNCSWDCPSDDDTCWDSCWQNASPDAQEQFILVWQCVLDVCGNPPADNCVGQAVYYGACKDEFNSCLNCTPACTGKQCGADGCNGSCGTCPTGYVCDAFGYCDCTANCSGKECGNDGCNGSCGECSPGSVCSQYGKCVCVPQCAGAMCGSDGCGGVCGTCQQGYTCQGNQCVTQCVPSCFGKACGPDGCGGQCGYCPPGLTCSAAGQCLTVGPVCGDTKCDSFGGETCASCPEDCTCSGDCCEVQASAGCVDPDVMQCVCQSDPYCCEASWDNVCVDEVQSLGCGTCGCQPQCAGKACGSDGCGGICGTCPSGSTCSAQGICVVTCTPQCSGKQCGADGCGGTCGTCGVGYACNATGTCVCVPNCTGKSCGSDGCGGSCGTCGNYQTCTGSGQCAWVTPLCGDGSCSSWLQENCDSCPQDCGTCCGNGSCDSAYLESCASCSNDCGTCCGNGYCEPAYGETCTDCPTDCGACPAKCGDGVCEADGGESCSNCAVDCGSCEPVCGDGICDAASETCATCDVDCGSCQESCCTAHDSPGCLDSWVQECVCSMDSFCCSVTWDDYCASLSDQCGSCGEPACYAHQTPGADDEAVESCVCSYYPECCLYSWDDMCVQAVEMFGCGSCQTGFCGDGICTSDESCELCPMDCGPCTCQPDCEGKMCGSDGCDGLCGECPDGFTCSAEGMCEPGTTGQTCSQLVDCALACGNDWNCTMACYGEGTPEAQSAFMDLLSCASGQCGLPPDSNCLYMSFMGACYTQYSYCVAN